ncbi:hypothetical protein KC19_8G069700 [Ceratodon purpureus]|uniref:Phosphatidic acid phosphatase type 2/haloperoxidase domain-containing protein n=1 Tax=Ceratodon purpureus TaxID=3225 RepID=A0A8T0GVZ3_CERPU|nr:hypothetical protein KC19_8G069700 [Ceratodon purpureus]KAG0563921.1 hypothetical protein KC19_8G069700 [Ceratodon purpureus]
MKKGPVSPQASPRRIVSRIQTKESRQATVAAKASGGSFETPAWVLKMIVFDRRYSKWVHETFFSDWAFFILRFFEFSGDGLFWLPGTAAFWLSPSAGSPDTRMFALNLFIGLLLDFFVVGCIKSAVQRKRPQYNTGHLMVVSMDQWSFPSGHSSRAVMIVSLIWLYSPMWRAMISQYWWPYLVLKYEKNHYMSEYVLPYVENNLLRTIQFVLMLWLTVTACSRVVLGRHYILDVLGGEAIGVLEALVTHFCLHVPLKVSELQHAYLLSRFGLYEEMFWNIFHGRWFFTNYHFREMNRVIDGEINDVVGQPA